MVQGQAPQKGKKVTKKGKNKGKKTNEKEKEVEVVVDKFVAVNSVFRCNRFVPGDNRFKLHMDTPYYDASQKHISKYTILIYLSAGQGKPALRIGGGEDGTKGPVVTIDKLNALQCVIFDQQYEHEGSAFESSPKVFLRSELIFQAKATDHKPEVGALFSSAIYYTLETTFQPSFAKHAHDLYEQVNQAHWGKDTGPGVKPQLLHKCWKDTLPFATNGYDYFFPYVQGDNVAPHEAVKMCAVIAVLDHFNCSVEKKITVVKDDPEPKKKKTKSESTAFRKECLSNVIPSTITTTPQVLEYLWTEMNKRAPKHDGHFIGLISKERKEEWLSEIQQKLEDEAPTIKDERFTNELGEKREICCPFHYEGEIEDDVVFPANKSEDIVQEYTKAYN